MKFKTFEDIEAWQEARTLARMVRQLCVRATVRKDWAWADQISRAALSIMANIAEGNDASTNPEFLVFLGYAKRSAAEVRSHLYYGLDEGYVTKVEFTNVADRTKKISAQIARLMQYLRQHDRAKRFGIHSSNEPTRNEQLSCQ